MRPDETWESLDFVKLCKALRLWTRCNPVDSQQTEKAPELATCHQEQPNKLGNKRYQEPKPRGCVYHDTTSHKSGEWTKLTTTNKRKQILAKWNLCFNCTGAGHRAAECSSKVTCQRCERQHHTSIGNQATPLKELVLTTTRDGEATSLL